MMKKKRLLCLLFLVFGIQLDADALRVRNNKITYEVDLSAHTAEVIARLIWETRSILW